MIKNFFLLTALSSIFILCKAHIVEHRPWGFYEIIANNPQYKIKKIVVYPHRRLSLQRHQFREEYWIILQGNGLVTLNDTQTVVTKGSTVHVKLRDIHRIENTGNIDLEFIEVQTGIYFGEDDIERLADDYGRAFEVQK